MNALRSLAALSALSIGLVACADGPTAPRAATVVTAGREAQPGDTAKARGKDDPTTHFSREAQPGDTSRARGKDDPIVHSNREAQPGDDRGGHGKDDPTPHT